ncbi:MAG: acetyl-CoA carboxylase biotin carboxylase subunit [Alphaproteobacteria bacterium]|nr:acetyl-CoA carboxylase biotin carboxylase subunit [Alphaproteobacteria bacterium]
MFSKILIANRGEIACRIIRTARRMGIKTVAVYSEADARALHVRMADEAVPIGAAPAAQSYLVADRIVAAAKESGADAVHPGFGFLSENAGFAERLEAAGIVFIGPKPKAIAAMGDKIESKRIAQKAGVSTVPGHTGVVPDVAAALRIAAEVGYPVMIKASAGGGGKGMRIARNEAETREGFTLARSEAKSSFGDDRVFIERYIEQPRHIEIQVLGDGHGNIVHLGERECSIQRRHQKVIEEAPSPFLDAKTRAAMGAQAVALARAVDYQSAGTVEFIVDGKRNFYFLEMNTRLQVEHPVTEYVTGLDLVEQMIRIAAGERLAFGQKDVKLEGWAIEARIYAEDPMRNFLPSTGRLVRYRAPAESDHVRVDSGVFEGGEISMFYDPMIAKLVAGGATRAEAIARMRDALDAFYVRGISHNIPFLASVLGHPRFVEGRLSTAFIADEYPDGLRPRPLTDCERLHVLAVAGALQERETARRGGISGRVRPAGRGEPTSWIIRTGGEAYRAELQPLPEGCRVALWEQGKKRDCDVAHGWKPGDPLFRGLVGGEPVCVQVDRHGIGWRLSHMGIQAEVQVLSPRTAELARRMPEKAPPDLSRFLLSPMPGLLLRLAVAEGDSVKAGEELAVVEAMKMENVLRAERDGVIKTIHAEAGESLAVDQPILEFE